MSMSVSMLEKGESVLNTRRADALWAGGTSGVLLLARCAVNDEPLGVYETTGIAEAAAKQFTKPEVLFIARSILGVESVDIMRVDVITIVRGMPLKSKTVIDFQEDENDDD
jgi:hypothetical protein